jgi:hypothetical protein
MNRFYLTNGNNYNATFLLFIFQVMGAFCEALVWGNGGELSKKFHVFSPGEMELLASPELPQHRRYPDPTEVPALFFFLSFYLKKKWFM